MGPEGPALHPPSSAELEAHIGMSGSSWQALLSSLIVRGVVTRRDQNSGLITSVSSLIEFKRLWCCKTGVGAWAGDVPRAVCGAVAMLIFGERRVSCILGRGRLDIFLEWWREAAGDTVAS